MRIWTKLVALLLLSAPAVMAGENLVANGDMEKAAGRDGPAGFVLSGAAVYDYVGDERRDISSMGVKLQSSRAAGEVSCVVGGIDATVGRWYRFTFRGLPQRNFEVADHQLYMRVEFYGDGGATSYDSKEKRIYEQVLDARRDLDVNGVHKIHGAEVWRTYQLDFMIPFPQVDQLKLCIGFAGGQGRAQNGEFWLDDVALERIDEPAGYVAPTEPATVEPAGTLMPIGGRWYYLAAEGETEAPRRFDSSNVDRLLYKDAGYSTPFAGNTSATMLPGFMDLHGNVVQKARELNDNVVIRFENGAMVIATHGIPNHPTGRFPEQGFGNPSYITEQNATYYIPLEPRENKARKVIDAENANGALPMGPIGIAVNGVVFFNPFDLGTQDATDLMDRCCGHPQQQGVYHYHKYPICVNTPWADEGKGHSPLLGWAFDGYAMYGPYESADVMAKDVTGEHALNAFNMHYDDERGWHYHVTPGKFPYLLGGYWGVADARNVQRPGPGGMGPGRQRGGQPGAPPPGGMGQPDHPPPPPGGRPPR